MTLRMPGVQYVGPPDSNWSNGEFRPPNGMVVHIAEGSLWGTVGWQQNPASDVSSYFVIGRDGTILQMLDLDLMAWTQGAGNQSWIGVENEGFSTQGFTDAQVTANARVFAWIVSLWPSVGYAVVNSPGAFGLGWHGMGGVAWGNHPNCLPLDTTEVLTPSGWIFLRDVNRETLVASVSMDSNILTFDRPVEIIEPYLASTVSLAGFEMTPDHRVHVFRTDHPTQKILTAEEIGKVRTNWIAPCFGDFPAAGAGVGPDLIRLLVWVQADGHYENDGGRLPILHFHLSKMRKVTRISEILDRLGVAYKLAVRSDGTISIRVREREWLQENVMRWLPRKRWESWLLNSDAAEFTAFDEEVTLADGCEKGGQRFYFTNTKSNADWVQALYVTHGRAASIYRSSPDYGYTVNLHAKRKGLALRNTFRKERHEVLVGCLTTQNDTILIRQAGRVMVVGNCPGSVNVAKLPTIAAQARQINQGGNPLPPIPGWDEGEDMHFAREPNGSVWWVGIGVDPATGKPYRRGGFGPVEWGRWEAAGFPTVQLKDPMVASDWATLPTTGQPVTATCTCDCQCEGGGDAPSAQEVAVAVADELHSRLEN